MVFKKNKEQLGTVMALLKWLALFIKSYVDLKLKRGLKYEVCQIKGVRGDFPECYD